MNRTGRYHSSRDVVRDADDYERAAKRRRDERSTSRDASRQPIDPQYRTLCISSFSQRVPDEDVKEAIYHEFVKFGDFTVKIIYSGTRRLAYVDFRYPEDAFAAKQFHQDKLVLFDEPVRVDVVYSTKPRGRSRSPADMGGDSYRRRSPYGSRSAMKDGNSGYDVPRDGGNFYERPPPKDSKYHQHIPPEDDETATRTLFVGNLDYDVTADQLQSIFECYGYVEDVDVKRAAASSGAYAFIRFANLDMAFRAKVEMSGQIIGRHQCRIGYGKVIASPCLWVGGIGPWLTPEALGRVFGRHAEVQSVEWPPGKNYAYVVCASIDEARCALASMRGAPLGGQDRRLRVDFADLSHIGMNFDLPRNGRAPAPGRDSDSMSSSRRDHDMVAEHRPDDSRHRYEDDAVSNRLSSSGDHGGFDYRTTNAPVLGATSIDELAAQLPVVWSGRLMLKNSAFAIKLHLIEGETCLVDSLLRDPASSGRTSLKITQRLRLDESKISEVRRRVSLAGPTGYCLMLAVPVSDANATTDSHHRPLKNLVTYLRQKDAAGVILLPPHGSGGSRGNHDTGLLHAFPPCDFARQQLGRRAPHLNSDMAKEDHLVVLVIRLTP